GAVGLLKVRRSAEVVEVAVADDDVFDLLRIESGLLHSGDQNLFGVFRRIQGVDDNDALTRCERPGTDVVEADVIKIVEDLRRLERLPGDRRQTRFLPQHGWPLRSARGAQVPEFVHKIRLGKCHGLCDVLLRFLRFLELLLGQASWRLPALGNKSGSKQGGITQTKNK